jgi:transcriptional regulator with GAF, ATPase, and Fis domain
MKISQSALQGLELWIESGGWSRRLVLDLRPAVLGRSGSCEVPLPDASVSRQHCRLTPEAEGGWKIEPLAEPGSLWLNGAAVEGAAPLRPGDRLELGAATRIDARALGAARPGGGLRPAEVELLLDTVQDLTAAPDLQDLLRKLVDRGIRVAGGERGALLLAGPDGELEAGVARDAAGRELDPDEVLTRSLPARALQTGRPVVLTDAEAAEQRPEVSDSVLREGLRSVVCVPLRGQEAVAGVLYIDSRRPADAFGHESLALLEALTVHGGLAIERARLIEARARGERSARERLEAENAVLRTQLGAVEPLGESEPMLGALEMLRRVAPSEATVCLAGETGTGKEVFARALHRLSRRASGPFVVVDCGALPEGLIESELFGHTKGAFTGAQSSRVGRFREADGGTLLLDEIGELPLALQTRLLRVLQDRAVQPLGGREPVPVDVRVVCATHRNLEQRVDEGLFRQDLYYRVALLTLPIPPLRERGEDVVLLARHFLARQAAACGVSFTGFSREAVEALLAHAWPGNVRELEHRVQRAVLLATPPLVTRRDLGLGVADLRSEAWPAEAGAAFPPLREGRASVIERYERTYLKEVLQRARGNVARAAELACVTRQNLHHLLHRHGIDWRDFTA